MCTSMAAKPARSKAAAISTWPLTPCSRRIAMRGRRRLMNGAATSSAGSKLSAHRQARVAGIEDAVVFLLGAFRVSRSRCSWKLVSDQARCRSTRFR
jgi:hypothetical protein